MLSLEPAEGPTSEAGNFWDWHVLGSVMVHSSDRDELILALDRGIAENQGWVAECFIPRHGIRAIRGSFSVELVLCFQCAQVYIYTNGTWSECVLVTGSPQPMFDTVLAAAQVPLAKPR